MKMMCVAVLGLVALVGCKSTQEEEQCIPADATAAAAPGFINAACPVMPQDDARESGVAVAYTGSNPEWAGKQIALCCKGCISKWDKMSQAERDERLAKVAVK
ncbi:MAG: hypothetical protein AMXMBFR58_12150 [Phycisphaerae bacterium]|nr:hypothetical protein [Phycisphaerales bacterium]